MRARLLTLLIALATLPLASADDAVEPVEPGVVEGHVLDPDGAPVPNATVYAFVVPWSGAHAWTDANGHFRVEIAPGRLHLSAEPNASTRDASRVAWGKSDCDLETCPEVVSGRTTHVNLTLPWAGVVQGNVTWPDGSPAQGIDVWVQRRAPSVIEARNVTTAADGSYRLTLAQGYYTLQVHEPNGSTPDVAARLAFLCRSNGHTECWHVESGVEETLDITLVYAANVTGHVLDRAGRPVPGAFVRLEPSHIPEHGMVHDGDVAHTDASGRFFLQSGPGAHEVLVDLPHHAAADDEPCEWPRRACLDLVAGATLWRNLTRPDEPATDAPPAPPWQDAPATDADPADGAPAQPTDGPTTEATRATPGASAAAHVAILLLAALSRLAHDARAIRPSRRQGARAAKLMNDPAVRDPIMPTAGWREEELQTLQARPSVIAPGEGPGC